MVETIIMMVTGMVVDMGSMLIRGPSIAMIMIAPVAISTPITAAATTTTVITTDTAAVMEDMDMDAITTVVVDMAMAMDVVTTTVDTTVDMVTETEEEGGPMMPMAGGAAVPTGTASMCTVN